MAKKTTRKDTAEGKPTGGSLLWVYLLLGLFLFGVMYARNLSMDVLWHLRMGQWMLSNHAFPFTDPFSYTARNPIILSEWGAEVIQWLVYSRISPAALAVMSIALISTAFILAFRLAFIRSRHTFASFVVVALGAAASSGWSEMRPHVFSSFFFMLAVMMLYRFHECGSRRVWLLVPLVLVWSNMHGAFIAGISLITLEVVIALVSPPAWAQNRPNPRLASAGLLVLVGTACALAALVNPNAILVYEYPIRILGHPAVKNVIFEWKSPSFQEWPGRWLLLYLGVMVVGLIAGRSRPSFRDVVYVLFFAAATLVARRNVVFLSIACSAPIALWFSDALEQGFSRLSAWRLEAVTRVTAWALTLVLVLSVFFWRVSDARSISPFDYMNPPDFFPVAACDYIMSSDLEGPMFNDLDYGGYLIWRLWPKYKVFVDTRLEPFLKGALEESMCAVCCNHIGEWERIFEKRGVNFAVVNPSHPLASVLVGNISWVSVYQDNRAVIFVRDIPENSAVIRNTQQR